MNGGLHGPATIASRKLRIILLLFGWFGTAVRLPGNAKDQARETLPHTMSERQETTLNKKDQRPGDNDPEFGVATKTKPKLKKPSQYRVLLLNDDFTPMEFVVHVLERFFSKSPEQATQIMLHVHTNGVGECGVFTYEVAETKVTQVMDFAAKHQHPLQCVMEKK